MTCESFANGTFDPFFKVKWGGSSYKKGLLSPLLLVLRFASVKLTKKEVMACKSLASVKFDL